ncbi:hypothetical protein HELRODRAFT_83902 [Helobdella robusta]|uniref:E3 ubiquitin-protein ligase n=1 Tax=Helobdella robusta TaxID=6412 RepID=T1G5B4_HELRO|nr:hypothetical protein HELRODRAFT_83902 [Helobdella robusta]ESN99743.1 hypothetical protein HELRODRAFT_83902 [Helobdella robusta]
MTLGVRRRSGSVDTRPKSQTKTIDSSQSKDDLTSANDCPICLSQITGRPKILSCGHCFCMQCINQWLVAHNKCPVCNRCFGVQRGNQPDGRMDVSNEPYSLPGYKESTSIKIQYSFPDGIQQKDQPNPGKPYTGTRRIAYLPNNQDGREVLHLLKIAFDNRLIFTIGRSNTTGRDNVVVWNDVHHKTSTSGTHGYPDSGYLKRVKDELQAKGITTELLSVKK